MISSYRRKGDLYSCTVHITQSYRKRLRALLVLFLFTVATKGKTNEDEG
jgi:hypothetical protein